MTNLLAFDDMQYFLPPRDWFWEWRDSRRAACWVDGVTIAFSEELESILKALAPQGLPPMAPVLLLLAACRDNWTEASQRSWQLMQFLVYLEGTVEDLAAMGQLNAELHRINGLPSDLRRSPRARSEMAVIAFEGELHRTDSAAAGHMLESWKRWREDGSDYPSRPATLGELRRDVYTLLSGISRITESALRGRVSTGLEVLPRAADLEPLEPQPARSLLEELGDSPELCGLAAIARHLQSLVTLPRPVADPGEVQEGGISDIVNRGRMDRLLLSELAQDEMVLVTRVAMNEALYYRHESPPAPPAYCRKVLLDSGVRTWGVPRVFITAVGLAFTTSASRPIDTAVFRATGASLDDVDFTCAEGVAAHLAVLETAAHPGAALAEFRSRLDAESGDATEGIVITTEDGYDDPDFHEKLRESACTNLFIATVSRQGRFRLLRYSRQGVKPLREATLDLDRLLATRPKRPRLLEASVDEPAIFRVDQFPLLLHVPLEVERTWYCEDVGALTYTRDGRLLLWEQRGRGGRQLAEGLPKGWLFACESSARNGRVLAVVGKRSEKGLYALTIDLRQPLVASVPLQLPFTPTMPVTIQSGMIWLRADGNSHSFDPDTGEIVSSYTVEREYGRTWLGNTPQHEKASSFGMYFPGSTSENLLASFQSQTDGKSIAVDLDGNIIVLEDVKTTRVSHRLQPPLQFEGLSRDCRRFLLSTITRYENERQRVVVEVETGAAKQVSGDLGLALEPAVSQYVRPRILRGRFSGVGVNRSGQLCLVGRGDAIWPMELHVATRTLRLAKQPNRHASCQTIGFEAIQHHVRGYSLHVARFPSGTVAWLDGRGLLHLRTDDRDIPEISLVICEGPSGGWLSDGRVWGAEAFHSQGTSLAVSEMYTQVLSPILESMR